MKGLITASKTYRYYTHGNPEKASKLLYVLHGYGQLAEYFIRKFHFLSDDYFIVAPEGMHRFYTKGTSGRVGASWMTSADREMDIKDNINWLNQLDAEINTKYAIKEKILLGFSQGGSTAIRQHFYGAFQANHLVIWAGSFPPEMETQIENCEIGTHSRYFVLGEKDEFCFGEEQSKAIALFNTKGFSSIRYEGNHDIESSVLLNLLKQL